MVFETGLTPVFRETILAALDSLHKERFFAVVIHVATTRVDVLELILNIRDVDEAIRIFVLSEARTPPDELSGRGDVSFVNRKELVHKLTPTSVPVAEARRSARTGGRKRDRGGTGTDGSE
jgi:hypothetical protein